MLVLTALELEHREFRVERGHHIQDLLHVVNCHGRYLLDFGIVASTKSLHYRRHWVPTHIQTASLVLLFKP